ncbi:MAG: dienelactone hydrolase family protein [Acidobacteria bacterium]|nr:dienelactone hydrolase family protein [Acidobacteriota bacterium]
MRTLVATAVAVAVGGLGAAMNPNGELLAQAGGRPSVEHRSFDIEGHGAMPYAVSVPAGYDPATAHALVLALHPGGAQGSYYGSRNMRTIFEPALRGLNAVVVAPDAPTRRWATDVSDRGVMALLNEIAEEYNIDRSRILVTGFSLGGRGTWFFATRHPDFFTGAIPIAGRPGDDPLDALGDMPVHIIHSRADEVVPVGPAEDAAGQLRDAGGNVVFTALDGIGHFTMGAYVPALRDAGEWMAQQWAER